MEIEGLKAILIGGASGFARATAERIAAGGGKVAILDREQSAGAEVAAELSGSWHPTDVLDFDGIQLVIDGFPVETVRDIMELEADWQFQRHSAGRKVLESAAATAPAFGMVGTLIGLVKMLANLSNPDDIGAGMSVALLTTLYGAMLANMVLIPLAGKLEVRAKEEVLLRDLMVEGIIAIQSGEKPQLIKEKLKSFLAPSARAAIED